MPEGGGEQRVPGDLAVEVSVDVDEARGDELALGVDFFAAGLLDVADDGDQSVVDGDVSGAGGRAAAVDEESVADDEIVHGCFRCFRCFRYCRC